MPTSDHSFFNLCQAAAGEAQPPGRTILGPGSRCVLENATLDGSVACDVDLSGGATLIRCTFSNMRFERCDLSEARFLNCKFRACRFFDCDLEGCCFAGCMLNDVVFEGATCIDRARFEECPEITDFQVSDVRAKRVEFTGSTLMRAVFRQSLLNESKFLSNTLDSTTFRDCSFVDALFSRNHLRGCAFDGVNIDGVGAWSNEMDAASRDNQSCLLGAPGRQVRVRHLETGHFHSIVGNVSYSYLIDELCGKCVLLLGRFCEGNRETLRCLQDGLHAQGLLPVVFDFEGPKSRNLTETVNILAHMSKFVIADLTDQRSVGHELQAIIPRLAIPVVPVIRGDAPVFALFDDYRSYDWVLDPLRFASLEDLSATIKSGIVDPANNKLTELSLKRARFSRTAACAEDSR